ncbi:hypothetical protein CW748_17355 [Alteromonadales bacterium alter-6D02]|nr:hypothetical protein CW748_17355 [Alteromonadales bacterium alter-6D02]
MLILCYFGVTTSYFSAANERDQATTMHIRLTGIAPDETVLSHMAQYIEQNNSEAAAYLAMENPSFYNITLKNWSAPWTNRDADIFVPLNDYTATVIGMVRDDVDFREVLSGDIVYIANDTANVPAYSASNNGHYAALEAIGIDLKDVLQAQTQSQLSAIPAAATAGVVTSRAAAKSFFKDGTNRAMLRFTLINHLCTDLEALKDTTRSPDRIRQDVSRSPGGDSRLFMNSCSGCHSGMDPLAQAYAYYNYDYDSDSDPDGDNGQLSYNQAGVIDSQTGTRVDAKYHINSNNFKYGFITDNDQWTNYWRSGVNANQGWNTTLPAQGHGAKSLGQELANSEAFAQCQAKKVFNNVCLREPDNAQDRQQVATMVSEFKTRHYQIKPLFSSAANYCKGS